MRTELSLGALIVEFCIVLSSAATTRVAAQSSAPPARATRVASGLAAAPDRFITVNGARLRYREIGRGEPIVVIHGLSRTLEDWIGLGDSLAIDHRVIAFDLRGHGQSSKFADPSRFGRQMANDVPKLLDQLGVQRAHIVGHSLGALVAANVATRFPARVLSVVMLSGPFFSDSASAATTMAPVVTDLTQGRGMRAFFHRFEPGMPDAIVSGASDEIMAHNDRASLTAIMAAFGALTVTKAAAARSRTPALFVVGTDDSLLEYSRGLSSAWPRARLVEVAGAGHIDVLERPELLAAVRLKVRGAR